MGFETMIDANLAKFKQETRFDNISDNDLFEIYINHLFARHYRFFDCMREYDKFSLTNVGGGDDAGIDGIFVTLNGSFVYSKQDVDRIAKNCSSLDVGFVFIQSKNKTSIDTGEFSKFFSGIKGFLSEQQFGPINSKIEEWRELKDYLFSPDFLSCFSAQPRVLAVFAYKGKSHQDPHISAIIKEFKSDIERIGSSQIPEVEIFDGERIFSLAKEVENNFEITIPYFDSFELKNTENVSSSLLALCNSASILQLIKDEKTGQLRRELFSDNVRDYQGETAVNREILDTLTNNPSKFCLLNNGITIVCKSCLTVNRQMRLSNPQIVNGCQTCTSIYNASKTGASLESVDLIVKVIATDDSEVMNSIIKGTNRQNVVYGESFEITREFHKNFEEFVKSEQRDLPTSEKIFYERRSNQLSGVEGISKDQAFGLSVLTQSYVSTFLVEPHCGFEHEINLLGKFEGQIFNDEDEFEPYFISALLFIKLDRLFRENFTEYRHFVRYKYQIMAIFVHLVAGRVPNLTRRNHVKEYCDKLKKAISNKDTFVKMVNEAIRTFSQIKNKWTEEKGPTFIHAIKDNSMFDDFMFTKLGYKYDKLNNRAKEENAVYTGVVTFVKKDRNGLFYGYIKADPVDIFVHEDDCPKTIFSSLVGKRVKYKILSSGKYNNPRGKIINVLPWNSDNNERTGNDF